VLWGGAWGWRGAWRERVSPPGLGRRYDAVVTEGIGQNKYYEFKSYSSVPPPNFAEQFMKDLRNPDITNLNQLKWIFDAAKKPPEFVENMKKAIDNLPIGDDLVRKFVKNIDDPEAIDLKDLLKKNFSTIFQIK
jgi:hypothetical protein